VGCDAHDQDIQPKFVSCFVLVISFCSPLPLSNIVIIDVFIICIFRLSACHQESIHMVAKKYPSGKTIYKHDFIYEELEGPPYMVLPWVSHPKI
jgi:hypothetical protein